MTEIYPLLALLLVLNIFVGLTRVLRGPTAADRMLAAEMFSTSAVVIVLLLSVVTDRPIFVDVALVFALLSALTVAAFVGRAWHAGETPASNDRQEENPP